MSLNEDEQRKVNALVQFIMEDLTVDQIIEVQYQLTEYLGVLKKDKRYGE